MFQFEAVDVLESGPLYGLGPIEAVERVALRSVCPRFLLGGAEFPCDD